MARGREGAFGGKTLLRWYVWLAFCLVFLVGLADLRRPLSVRNLDLVALLGFTASLAFFDRGEIFRSVPLVYPVLAYLLARGLWVGFGRRGTPLASVWPTWVLAAAAVFLLGFRVGLNLEAPRGVIDVGLAGSSARAGSSTARRRTGTCRSAATSSRAGRRTPRDRCASASRRTAAARRGSSAATRTARSRTSPTFRRSRSSRGAGSGTRFRRRTRRRSRSTCSRCSRSSSSDCGSAAAGWQCCSRSRGPRIRSPRTR